MQSVWRVVGAAILSMWWCVTEPTVAFSLDEQGNDIPAAQQSGKTIHGKIVKVVKSDAATHTWDVSVESEETGEMVALHLDKTTARKVTDIDPAVGEKVVVKYDENSMHAISFATVAAIKN